MYKCFFKRVTDLTLAIVGIVILFPILICTAICLLIGNKGNVFFLQARPGLNTKIFKIIKFKTMNDKRDGKGNLLSDAERLTPVGKLVRKLSLDELLQLINVIKGDMSLVGPRPLLPQYISLYNEFQLRRHNVKPGITGWAQINGRNTISWQQKFDLDVWYVENMSFWLDLKIIFYTFLKVLKSGDVNAGDNVTMDAFNGNN
ncbi:sugar transferase [Mucilaginibacter boryungensis]|uniref:Sugar transferase n=1 Tax=Mucilaginibacter boryungensis TaxID=768480 RepID=A0ABR9XFL1_9SPHI|nr:sugar transferase [Mucilaginibacter boryungensis]MBE9665845.1 sugar transferase [Mucilaginibacter boryungensis]